MSSGGRRRDTQGDAGAKRGVDTSPAGLALSDIARANFTDVSVEGAEDLLGREHWLEDDLPDEEWTPDFGARDDDEPYHDGPEERPAVRRPSPEIRFWNGKFGIEWEIRASSASLLNDDDAAGAVVQRGEALDRVARGLAEYVLVKRGRPIDLSGSLLAIWEDLNVFTIANPITGLEAAINGNGSSLSGSRSALVGFPGGRNLPLAFFTWKDDADDTIKSLAAMDDLLDISGEEAKRRLSDSGPSTVAKLFNWVRAVKIHPWIVAAHRARFRAQPENYEVILNSLAKELATNERERVRSESRRPPALDVDRASRVLYRALVGGIE